MKKLLSVVLVLFLLLVSCDTTVNDPIPSLPVTAPAAPDPDPYSRYTAFTDPLSGLIVTPEIQEALEYVSQNFSHYLTGSNKGAVFGPNADCNDATWWFYSHYEDKRSIRCMGYSNTSHGMNHAYIQIYQNGTWYCIEPQESPYRNMFVVWNSDDPVRFQPSDPGLGVSFGAPILSFDSTLSYLQQIHIIEHGCSYACLELPRVEDGTFWKGPYH